MATLVTRWQLKTISLRVPWPASSNFFDPEIIVVGCGLSNVRRLYHEVPRRLPNYVFSDAIDVRLVAAQHGDSSGVRGAAWLWTDDGA